MDIAIQDQRDNPLLEREEYTLQIDHQGDATPSVSKVRKKFAAENDLDPKKIDVESIYTRHGGNVSTVALHAYEDKIVVDEEPEADDDGEAEEESEEAAEQEESDDEADDEKDGDE